MILVSISNNYETTGYDANSSNGVQQKLPSYWLLVHVSSNHYLQDLDEKFTSLTTFHRVKFHDSNDGDNGFPVSCSIYMQ